MVRLILKTSMVGMILLIVIPSVYGADTLPVFVSILPQKFFVQQIGKSFVDVEVMVQPGASPATYEPKPAQMKAVSKSKLYFAIGVPFENTWLEKISSANPGMKVIRTDQTIDKVPMVSHDHGSSESQQEITIADSEEIHASLDPHIWLSPPLVIIQAEIILDALQSADPIHQADYAANYQSFVSEIQLLDNDLKHLLAGKNKVKFIVFHPSWGYFARNYGLEQIPIEIEGKAPKPAQLIALIDLARKEDIRVVFVQPQFSSKTADIVAREIRGVVAVADPLAENWFENLRNVAISIRKTLK